MIGKPVVVCWGDKGPRYAGVIVKDSDVDQEYLVRIFSPVEESGEADTHIAIPYLKEGEEVDPTKVSFRLVQ